MPSPGGMVAALQRSRERGELFTATLPERSPYRYTVSPVRPPLLTRLIMAFRDETALLLTVDSEKIRATHPGQAM